MSPSHFSVDSLARWAGRLTATALILFLVAFALYHGCPPINALSIALTVVIIGCVAAWFYDAGAALLILGGTAAFYFINYILAGKFPSGPVFPLLFVPGLLMVLALALKKRHATAL